MSKKFSRFVLDLLYPTRCPVCGCFIGYMDDFCQCCREKLTPFHGSFTVSGSDGFSAAFEYDSNISPAIMLMKDGVCGNAAFALGKALAEKLSADGVPGKVDLIIPVPLHNTAKRCRGFNQSELIAREVSERLHIPLCTKAVVKNRKTRAQKTLSREERAVNLAGAFSAVRPELFIGKRVLLLDDVCTTGSTLAELAGLLKNNGAAAVYCAGCCKTPLDMNKDVL